MLRSSAWPPRHWAPGRLGPFAGGVPHSAPTPRPAPPAGPGAREPDGEGAALLTAEPGESGVGLVSRVPRPLAVPADGGPHKTTVAWFELDATLDHLAVPVLAPEAYLRATVTNCSSLLPLPDPARAFHDAHFVGATFLDTRAAAGEFSL